MLLLLRLVGWSAMGLMGLWTGLWGNAPLVIIIFLIRTGVNNAGYPIQKSILMDHVPKVTLSLRGSPTYPLGKCLMQRGVV